MLSRLKQRRTPSSADSLPPPDSSHPADDTHLDLPPSPTPSSRSARRNFTSPVRTSDFAADSRSSLSPSRAYTAGATRGSRSSSTASLHPPDRRSWNLSLPADASGGGGSGGGLFVANGPGAVGGGPGGEGSGTIGQGSLSLDHLAPLDGATPQGAPMTLVVQAPELIRANSADGVSGSSTGGTTPTAESDDMRTPVPSQHADFDANALRNRGMSASSHPMSASSSHSSLAPPTNSRPRSHTTSEAIFPSRGSSSSGLDALAAINGGRSPAHSRPASPHRSLSAVPAPYAPARSSSLSRPPSRPASRSSSVTSNAHPSSGYPDHLSASSSLRPPPSGPSSTSASSSTSPSRGRKGASHGIAGALALSGVALASPSQTLRQPHGLVRISSDYPADRDRGGDRTLTPVTSNGSAGAASSASAPAGAAGGSGDGMTSSGSTSLRGSIDSGTGDAASPTGSDGGRLGGAGGAGPDYLTADDFPDHLYLDAASSLHNIHSAHGGFLSMDQLGDFDDVVSQLGTGYAVASSKRNADFHALFKGIAEDDYLIEDYGCALQREILIQGRLYISEHHLSFYANIFGWVTSLSIPFSEVCSIEKRMTAYVIPNAIQIATMHARHTFASFLSRDTTYDLIGNIWRMVHPVVPMSAALPDAMRDSDVRSNAGHSHIESDDEDAGTGEGGPGEGGKVIQASGVEAEQAPQKAKRRLRGFRRPRGGTGESRKSAEASNGAGGEDSSTAVSVKDDGKAGEGAVEEKKAGKAAQHPVTVDTCPTLKDLKEVCMDAVFPGKPEKIYNLMFTSGFMKDFWTENQKLTELQISDWAPQASGSNLLARSMSYIKPLNASIGPKSTKCLITDESAHVDFDDYVCVVTTTKTPDVPSGSAFAVKTRTSMTWARGNGCRVVVTTGVEWYKSSFIKGIITSSAIDGQKTYHTDLEKAMRTYITTHRNEFVEEGQDPDSESLAPSGHEGDDGARTGPGSPIGGGAGAGDFPTPGTNSASSLPPYLSFLNPVWSLLEPSLEQLAQQSPKTLLLGLILAILVLSNIWTLRSSSSGQAGAHPVERAARARGEYSPPNPSPSASFVDGHGAQQQQRGVGAPGAHDVASAVRDVLQDYFAAAGHGQQHAQRAAPAASSSSAWASPLIRTEELRELEDALDRIEGRVRKLREELSTERKEVREGEEEAVKREEL
ncbi:hypothetical protein JCM11251_004550 [Rhodosporidiobolus azoricus]